MILAETGDELLRRQDHFGARLSVKVPNDLEGHDQSRPFSKAALLVPRCTIGANLVILAETGDELLRRQDHFGARLSVKVPNDLEGHDQSRPFSKAALLVPRCTIGANLVILAETGDELLRRQDHFGARLSVKVPNDLEGHDQSRPFSKAALLVPRCTIGANLVILAETGDELSRRQGRYGQTDRQTDDGRTDGRTDRQTEVTTIPLRPLRPRGKKEAFELGGSPLI